MSKKRKIWNKDKFPPIIAFAIATLFVAPIISSFVFPPDSQMPIIISAYLTLFWTIIACGWIWWMIIGIYRERKAKQTAIKETVHGMVSDLDLLRPARHEELMMALSYGAGGDEKALKKLDHRAFWAVFKFATWISVLLLLIPFSALQYIHVYIIIGWIFLFFAHLFYTIVRDQIRNDENLYESAAMGLILDKSNQIATGTRFGRKVAISFMDFGSKTTVSGAAGTFAACVKKKSFELDGKAHDSATAIFDKLTSKKRTSLWRGTTITSNDKEIIITLTIINPENSYKSGFWMCDLWLAEWLVSRKEIRG